MSTKRTITLTGRPPVTINEEDWSIIAETFENEHDGQVECQANRRSDWWIKVRQHADGRALVYAGYKYTSNWLNARCYAARRGVLLEEADASSICEAIQNVGEDIARAEHNGGDAGRWPTLAADCIAEMPAEVLD